MVGFWSRRSPAGDFRLSGTTRREGVRGLRALPNWSKARQPASRPAIGGHVGDCRCSPVARNPRQAPASAWLEVARVAGLRSPVPLLTALALTLPALVPVTARTAQIETGRQEERIAFSGCDLNNHSGASEGAVGQACHPPRLPDQAIDLFDTKALSAVVPLKIDLDLRFTVIAATLYGRLADRIGHGQRHQALRALFHNFFYATTDLSIDEPAIAVRFGWCVNNSFLAQQGFAGERGRVPSLGNRMLRLACGENGQQYVTSESAVRIEAAGIAERRLELGLEALEGSTVPGWISFAVTNGGVHATRWPQPTPQQLKEDTKCV